MPLTVRWRVKPLSRGRCYRENDVAVMLLKMDAMDTYIVSVTMEFIETGIGG